MIPAPEDHDAMMKDMPGMLKAATDEKKPHTHAPGDEHHH